MTEKMSPYLACAIVEGFDGEHTEDEIITAWQFISDTGLWKVLQGFYGRGVANLIEEGIISG